MTKTFVLTDCILCGQIISSNGLSQSAHAKMHVREGYLKPISDRGFIRYIRTDKPFDREEYQKSHPERAYNHDDYFPITGHSKDARLRKAHIQSFVARKQKGSEGASNR